MLILKDLILTNLMVFKKTNALIAKHHLLMYVGLIYGPLLYAANVLGNLLPLFGGMVIFLSYAMVLSNYFHLMHLATSGYKTDWEDIKDGFFKYSRQIFGLLFLFYVAFIGLNWFVIPMLPGLLGLWFLLIVIFLVVVLLNALPEVIYLKNFGELDSIQYAWSFLKTNALDWGVPMVLLLGFNLAVYRMVQWLNVTLLGNLPGAVAQALLLVVMIIVFQFSLGYTMIYRGLLFTRLDKTTRQKRVMQVVKQDLKH